MKTELPVPSRTYKKMWEAMEFHLTGDLWEPRVIRSSVSHSRGESWGTYTPVFGLGWSLEVVNPEYYFWHTEGGKVGPGAGRSFQESKASGSSRKLGLLCGSGKGRRYMCKKTLAASAVTPL